jgi:cytidyltransferase-like protein
MTDLPLHPEPPVSPPDSGLVVLGRFQPFHHGHALLIKAVEEWRDLNASEMSLIIAIGSSNRPESMENPWSSAERIAMLNVWLEAESIEDVSIVSVPDIEDPPNWVVHAEMYHGAAGVFFTSDIPSAELYENAGWPVVMTSLEQRDSFEGWRVRETARMMSTVGDEEAVRSVLSHSVPPVVVDHLISCNALRRLAFLGEGGEPVG